MVSWKDYPFVFHFVAVLRDYRILENLRTQVPISDKAISRLLLRHMKILKQKALLWKHCRRIFLPISDRRLVTNLYCWSHGNRTIPRTAICQQRSLQISRILSRTFGRCFNPQLTRSHNRKVIFSSNISPRNNFIFEMMTELSKWLYIKPILRFVHFHGFYEPYPLFS